MAFVFVDRSRESACSFVGADLFMRPEFARWRAIEFLPASVALACALPRHGVTIRLKQRKSKRVSAAASRHNCAHKDAGRPLQTCQHRDYPETILTLNRRNCRLIDRTVKTLALAVC